MWPRPIIISGKRTAYGIAFIFLIFGAYAQKKRSLIVAEYRADSSMADDYTYLTKYNFVNGKLSSKDTLFGASTCYHKNETTVNCASFDFLGNRIHRGRYVISSRGDVVDLRTGALVNKGDKKLIEAMGDSLLYYEGWRAFEKKVFYFFNLKTKKFKPVRDSSFYTKGGLYSPDHRHSLQRTLNETNPVYKKGKVTLHFDTYKIVLSAIDKSSKVIVPFCHPAGRLSDFPETPMIWTGNEAFLYAEYPDMSPDQVIKSSDLVMIKRMNIRSLKTDTIGLIDSLMPDWTGHSFRRDKAGNPIFSCYKGDYKIDVSKKTITASPYMELGHGFKQEYDDETRDVMLYFEDKEFSRSKNYTEPVCTNGYLAMIVDEDSYLYVWSAVSREWITIEIPSICNIIGWLEEPE
jgi:hypothetical protein